MLNVSVSQDRTPFDYDPIKKIRLARCDVHFFPEGCARTIFTDGTHYDCFPHDTPHYREIAARTGYGHYIFGERPNIEAYCQEHDFCHSFIAERIDRNMSQVLWPLAHGAPVDRWMGVCEENLVMTFQRWLRADERPIIDRVDWDLLKQDALELLGDL